MSSSLEFLGISHPRGMTRSAQHFKRFCDCVAEFVDNSIQSCRRNQDIRLKIAAHCNFEKETGYFMIADNGSGMDAGTLEIFCSHGFSTEQRRVAASTQFTQVAMPEEDLISGKQGHFIMSKFGVGAKSAGFAMGPRLRIMSKMRDDEHVREVMMDKREMDRKFVESEKREDAYRHKMFARAPGTCGDKALSHATDNELACAGLIESCLEWERANTSFTIVLVELDAITVRRLSRNYQQLPEQLSTIYHFYLHPEHIVDTFTAHHPELQRSTRASSSRASSRPGQHSQSAGAALQTFAPVHIALSIYGKDGRVLFDVPDLVNPGEAAEDVFSRYFSQCKSYFTFDMHIPDMTSKSTYELVARPDGTRVYDGMHTLKGIVFYFSNDGDGETRPRPSSFDENGRKIAITVVDDDDMDLEAADQGLHHSSDRLMSQRAVNAGRSERVSAGAIDIDVEPDPVMHVLWTDRLLPDSSAFINQLPFFPKGEGIEGLTDRWKRRIKGFLFLPYSFEHVSNNKLFICNMGKDTFQDWIESNAKSIKYGGFTRGNGELTSPKQAELFKDWLIACNQKFDVDFILTTRLATKESQSTQYSYFQTLSIGKYASITDVYTGSDISIMYYEEPTTLYGDALLECKVTSLVLEDGRPVPVDAELADLKKQLIKSVELSVCEKAGNDVKVINSEPGKPIVLNSAFPYYRFGIRLIDRKNEATDSVELSDRPKILFKLESRLKIENDDLVDELDQSALWMHNTTGKDDLRPKSRADLARSYYAVYNRAFKVSGKGTWVIIVRNGTTQAEVFRTSFEIEIKAVAIAKFEHNLVLGSERIPFGSCLPPFSIQFFDKEMNRVHSRGTLVVRLRAKDLVTTHAEFGETSAGHAFQVDDGTIQFGPNIWSFAPTKALIPAGSSSVSIDVILDICRYDRKTDVIGKPIAASQCIQVEFTAGLCAKLSMMGRNAETTSAGASFRVPLDALSRGMLPEFSLQCVDQWGHATAAIPHKDADWFVFWRPDSCFEASNQGPRFNHSQSTQNDRNSRSLQTKVLVSGNGVATFSYLAVSAPRNETIGIAGLHVSEKFYLDVSGGIKYVQDGIDGLIGVNAPSFEIEIILTSAINIPASIKITRGGESIDSMLELPAGATLSDLEFEIVDSDGTLLIVNPDWFADREHSGFYLSSNWGAPTKAVAPRGRGSHRSILRSQRASKYRAISDGNLSLPNIELPPTAGFVEYDLAVAFTGLPTEFHTSIQVNVRHADNLQWTFVSPSGAAAKSVTVMAGEPGDLNRSVGGLALCDEYGNFACLHSSSISKPNPPVVRLNYIYPKHAHKRKMNSESGPHDDEDDDDDDEEDNTGEQTVTIERPFVDGSLVKPEARPLHLEEKSRTFEHIDTELCYYALQEELLEVIPILLPCQVELAVEGSGAMGATSMTCTVTNGRPKRLLLQCPSLGLLAPTYQPISPLVVPSQRAIEDMSIVCVDKCGFRARSAKIQSVRVEVDSHCISETERQKSKSQGGFLKLRAFQLPASVAPAGDVPIELTPSTMSGEFSQSNHLALAQSQTIGDGTTTKVFRCVAGILAGSTPGSGEEVASKLIPYRTQPSNRVTGLRVAIGHSESLHTPPAFLQEPVRISAFEAMPTLSVYFVTEDGQPFVPSNHVDCVRLTIKFQRYGGKRETIAESTIYTRALNASVLESESCLSFEGFAGSITEYGWGSYDITIAYQELRPACMIQNDGTEITQKLRVVKEAPFANCVYPDKELMVTKTISTREVSEQQRVICRSLSVCSCFETTSNSHGSSTGGASSDELVSAVGSHLLRAKLPPGVVVVCRIGHKGNHAGEHSSTLVGLDDVVIDEDDYDTESMPYPRLAKSSIRAYRTFGNRGQIVVRRARVISARMVSENEAFFDNLVLESGRGDESRGPFELTFEVAEFVESDVDTAIGRGDDRFVASSALARAAVSHIKNYTTEFDITTDNSLANICAQIDLIKHKTRQLDERERSLRISKHQLSVAIEKLRGSLTTTRLLDSETLTQDSLSLSLKSARRQLDELKRANPRPAKKPSRDPDTSGCNVIGQIVDLAYVSNEQDAIIISRRAGSFMDLVVIPDAGSQKTLLDRGIRCWDQSLARTHSPLVDIPANLRGHPEYILRMLILGPEHEGLRNSIFAHIFGKSILVDDYEAALEVREWLISCRMFESPVVCRTGEILRPGGIAEPKSANSGRPNYVFGDLGPHEEIRRLEADLRVFDELVTREEQQQELLRAEAAINDEKRQAMQWAQELRELEAQKEEILGSEPKRKRQR